MHKAIDVGCGRGSQLINYAHKYLPDWGDDIQVDRLDIDPKVKPDILHDLMRPMPRKYKGQYDLAYMSHVLEHIPFQHALSVAIEVASLLKEGGYFLILVPSMEFACREILRGNFNMGVMGLIYGCEEDRFEFHKCGFTRPALQLMAERMKMTVISNQETEIIVSFAGGTWPGKQLELLIRKEG